jgi:hypothetical protein
MFRYKSNKKQKLGYSFLRNDVNARCKSVKARSIVREGCSFVIPCCRTALTAEDGETSQASASETSACNDHDYMVIYLIVVAIYGAICGVLGDNKKIGDLANRLL